MPTAPFSGLRVALVAKFNRRYHQSGLGIRAGLEQLGCEVTAVEARARGLDRALGRTLARRLRSTLRRRRPDLVLSYKGAELPPAIVADARRVHRAVWANWFPDSPHNLELSLALGAAYDRVFLFDSWMVDRHRELGRPASFLPLGVDPDHWRPPAGPAGPPIPLVFVGTPEPLRDAALDHVADLGLQLWGPGRPAGPLFGPALMAAYSRAGVALNVHQFVGEPLELGRYGTGANQRVFELAALGVPQLVDAKADIAASFEPGADLAVFRTGAELRAQAERLLADPAGARAMGARARARALREHTWRHRLEQLLERALR